MNIADFLFSTNAYGNNGHFLKSHFETYCLNEKRCVFWQNCEEGGRIVSSLLPWQNTPENQHPKGGRIPCGLIVLGPLGQGHSLHSLCSYVGSEHHSQEHVVEKTCSPHSAQETKRDRKGIELKQTLPGHGPREHFPQRPCLLIFPPSSSSPWICIHSLHWGPILQPMSFWGTL